MDAQQVLNIVVALKSTAVLILLTATGNSQSDKQTQVKY